MSGLTIAGLARSAGVGVETVRYYQRRGLLAVPDRTPGAIRRYGDADRRALDFIRSAKAAGFTLTEIAELIQLDACDDRLRARHLAERRIAALDAEIARLSATRRALARLARECGAGTSGPCPILKAFEAT